MSILSKYASILNSRESPPPFVAPPMGHSELPASADSSDLSDQEELQKAKQKNKKSRERHSANPDQAIRMRFQVDLWNPQNTLTGSSVKVADGSETTIIDWHEYTKRFRDDSDTAESDDDSLSATSQKGLGSTVENAVVEGEEDGAITDRSVSFKPRRQSKEDVGDYDVDDPFIDDEEDYFCEQLEHRPTSRGYFVWRGPVPTEEFSEDDFIDEDDKSQPELPSGVRLPLSSKSMTIARASSPSNTPSKVNKKMKLNKSPFKKQTGLQLVLDQTSEQTAKANSPSPSVKSVSPISKLSKQKTFVLIDKTTNCSSFSGSMDRASVPEGAHGLFTKATTADFMETTPTALTPLEAQMTDGPTAVKQRKPVVRKPLPPLPDTLLESFNALKTAAQSVEFKKGKFPPAVKEPLVAFAQQAIDHYGGSWNALLCERQKYVWSHLKDVLPFQPATLKKIVDKELLPPVLQQREADLEHMYDAMTELARLVLENSLKSYEAKLAKWKSEHPEAVLDDHGRLVESAEASSSATANIEAKDLSAGEPSKSATLNPVVHRLEHMDIDVVEVTQPEVLSPVLSPPVNDNSTTSAAVNSAPLGEELNLPTAEQPPAASTKKDLPPTRRFLWNVDLKATLYKAVQAEFDLISLRSRLAEVLDSHELAQPTSKRLYRHNLSLFSTEQQAPKPAEQNVRRKIMEHIHAVVFQPVAGTWISIGDLSRTVTLLRNRETKDDTKQSPVKAIGKKRESKKKTEQKLEIEDVSKLEKNQSIVVDNQSTPLEYVSPTEKESRGA